MLSTPATTAVQREPLTPLRIAVGVLCIPLLYGYGLSFGELLVWMVRHAERYVAFGIGAALALGLWVAGLRGRVRFWEAFEHEVTHALFSVLCLKPVRSLKATMEGGYLVHEGGNLAIRLAPYFFPTSVVLPVALKPIVAAPYVPYLDGLIGATFVFHLIGTVHETHRRQPDLVSTGLVLSGLIISVLHMVFLGAILTIVGYGYGGVGAYLGRAFVHLWRLVAG